MQPKLNSYNFLNIYKELDINLKKLFCCMLDVNLSNEDIDAIKSTVPEDILYYSDEYPWIKGFVLEKNAHITLLFGLLKDVIPDHVKQVLETWEITDLRINNFSHFPSPNGSEHYCVKADIQLSPELLEGHQRLSLLPHINTFLDYKPHLTVAYIKKDEAKLEEILDKLNKLSPILSLDKISYDNMSEAADIIKTF